MGFSFVAFFFSGSSKATGSSKKGCFAALRNSQGARRKLEKQKPWIFYFWSDFSISSGSKGASFSKLLMVLRASMAPPRFSFPERGSWMKRGAALVLKELVLLLGKRVCV